MIATKSRMNPIVKTITNRNNQAIDKVVHYQSSFVLEDELGVSGHEYLYVFVLYLEYSYTFQNVRLYDAKLISATDVCGEVSLDPDYARKIELWLVNTYQHTDDGIVKLQNILGTR